VVFLTRKAFAYLSSVVVALHRGIDGSEPLRSQPVERLAGSREIRPDERSWVMATGTFACPSCDAPVMPAGPMAPADPAACPFCGHAGRVRDFLSLEAPSRPARVEVRIVRDGRALR
jgi:hypothetical protein